MEGLLGSPLVLIAAMFGVMYFFIIRPQATREKARKAMIEALTKGDKVVTAGGLHGTVAKLDDATVTLDVEGTRLRFDRNAIAQVRGDAPPK